MTFADRPTSLRPAGRGIVLLVSVVLAGLLGMHALSPGQGAVRQAATGAVRAGHHGQPPSSHASQQASHASHASDAPHSAPETLGCAHGRGGGHAQHADATCAAAGVSASYTPPALAAALTDLSVTAAAVGTPASTVSGRAPPDLAELQLLRI